MAQRLGVFAGSSCCDGERHLSGFAQRPEVLRLMQEKLSLSKTDGARLASQHESEFTDNLVARPSKSIGLSPETCVNELDNGTKQLVDVRSKGGDVAALAQHEASDGPAKAVGDEIRSRRVDHVVEPTTHEQYGARHQGEVSSEHPVGHCEERRDGKSGVADLAVGQRWPVNPIVTTSLAPFQSVDSVGVGRWRVDRNDGKATALCCNRECNRSAHRLTDDDVCCPRLR